MEPFTDVLFLALLIVIFGLLAWNIVQWRQRVELLQRLHSVEDLYADMERKLSSPEYSEKLMDYLQKLTTTITYLKTKEWLDGVRDPTLITEAITRNKAGEIANYVKDAINLRSIVFDRIIFTGEYFNVFIIQTAFHHVKTLVDQKIHPG